MFRNITANLVCAALVTLMAGSASAETGPKAFLSGNGLSQAKDPQAAGAEAAGRAKTALGDATARLVLVFDGAAVKDKAKMLQGVCSVFDPSIVYGCPGYNPITQDGNIGDVGVLAVAGNFKVTTALANLDGGHQACGKRIGRALRQAAAVESPGKLLVLFGDCHIPKDNDLVLGACSVLGEKFRIVGGASRGGVYEKGKFVNGANLGILLSGNFRCGVALKKDMSPEGLIRSAGEAVSESIGGGRPSLVLTFDCGGRRGKMGPNLPKELEAMKRAAGAAPIFGFYGSGEIGHKNNDAPSEGVGYSISACAILPE